MLTIRAYSKINLYLDVISRYSDGYHQIESVMQSVSLHDVVEITEASGISVSCTTDGLAGERNLAFRAAVALKQRTGYDGGAAIHIQKHIPVAAGLAGGSADAAAALAGLNVLWGLDLSLAQLQEIGVELGADVPFCLSGGTMLARGKGERLSPLPPMPDIPMVIATPPISVSTAEIYGLLDAEQPDPLGHIGSVVRALEARDGHILASALENILENIVLKRYPAILEAKHRALDVGGMGTLMSGSGPSIFVLCGDEGKAEEIASVLRAQYPSFFVEIARPVRSGVDVVHKRAASQRVVRAGGMQRRHR